MIQLSQHTVVLHKKMIQLSPYICWKQNKASGLFTWFVQHVVSNDTTSSK